MTRLGVICADVLSRFDLDDALGRHLLGKTAFVVGLPDHKIGKLGYINCQYGVGTGAAAVPQVEVTVSLYDTPARAARRAVATVADYRDHGAAQTATTVAGHDASILVGGRSSGYDVPLVVVASAQRTVALSVASSLVPAAKRNDLMTKIAALAVERSGG